MAKSKRKSQKRPPRVEKDTGNSLGTEADGKLAPWEAEAIMSSDLPSGDPELTPPAPAADQSPDFHREDKKKAA